MSQDMCEKNITGDFKDAENFSILNGYVVYKTDCSSWSKIVRNNLRLDDYLMSESIIKNKCIGLIGERTENKNVNNTTANRKKTSRKEKLEKKLIEIEDQEDDGSKWDKRMRCDYCNSIVDVVVCQYSWPNVNYYCDCNRHYYTGDYIEDDYRGYIDSNEILDEISAELEELFF
jgi:hypothetical protein